MKTLKRIFASTILILAICVPLYAGDVNLPAGPTPPPATCNDCDEKSSGETQTPPSDATSSAETKGLNLFAVDLLFVAFSYF